MDAPSATNVQSRREPLVVTARRLSWWMDLALLVLPVVLLLPLGAYAARSDTWAWPFGWLWMAMGGYGLLTCTWELPWLLRRRPLFVIDECGVTDHSTPFAVGFIAREEIVAVLVCRYGLNVDLGLRVRDRKDILARSPFLTRWFHTYVRRIGRASFVVSCKLTPVSPELLAHEICERYGVPAGIAMLDD